MDPSILRGLPGWVRVSLRTGILVALLAGSAVALVVELGALGAGV